MPDSSHRDPPAESPSGTSLADAVSVLRKATDSLRGGPTPRESSEATPPERSGFTEGDRQRYYRRLEERGALKDVDEGTDLTSLPSTLTHVRYPDGRVERVAYS